jgi:hypothetical protein
MLVKGLAPPFVFNVVQRLINFVQVGAWFESLGLCTIFYTIHFIREVVHKCG